MQQRGLTARTDINNNSTDLCMCAYIFLCVFVMLRNTTTPRTVELGLAVRVQATTAVM
jgi:hypothetical protein